MPSRWRRLLLGAPRNLRDPRTFHTVSLIALLAWVGLGADGLSSSAYGPDEAFRALGSHTYLAMGMALATTLTVLVISVAYSRIIARFPSGGGGYVVATRLLGPGFGLVSGCALLVDYVLTVSVSIASAADQIFSTLPLSVHGLKLPIEAVVIVGLVLLNLRGVRESVTILAPIFVLFIVTHAILVFGGIGSHAFVAPQVVRESHEAFRLDLRTIGAFGLLAVFMRAYSMGAGTYTGIEAVSNGLQIMREPKVHTARVTMTYMSVSLAITAGGILACYLLFHVHPEPGMTLNATLLHRFADAFRPGGVGIGPAFVVITLASEAMLLVVAAQTGFIDGPRVMANMATDSWLPHRFSQLSSQLVTANGVLIMGAASIVTLLYTRGDTRTLVTMYAINVFITFSLSQLGMVRYWQQRREPGRRRGLATHGVALTMCVAILTGTLIEKGLAGGWVTLVATGAVIAFCVWVRHHYNLVGANLRHLSLLLPEPPEEVAVPGPIDPHKRTAVLLVGSYGGLGLHSLLDMRRLFPDFSQVVFVSVGVVDFVSMAGVEEVEEVAKRTERSLARYVAFARSHGIAADYRTSVGTDAVEELRTLCRKIADEFEDRRRVVFFTSKLVFPVERWYQRLLHNETANEIQRRLQFEGLYTLVLPVRVVDYAAGLPAA
ncbi:MAG TPA: APC family permease [Candidatus Eisenbacteria bacterium]|nr:APC family permease [Candidatus Eisenbacteria bacterium]